ncbi:hypothetical protein RIF29_42358 [Crotalaria pallida]|uniref:Uncharacterized protein n=1 Tax=Crotalaria pallida TaxID=3830 RepID=A0AAN9E7F5_CROPI
MLRHHIKSYFFNNYQHNDSIYSGCINFFGIDLRCAGHVWIDEILLGFIVCLDCLGKSKESICLLFVDQYTKMVERGFIEKQNCKVYQNL